MSSYIHSLHTLESRLTGELVRPADGAYDSVRRIWNGRYDACPALIVRAANAQDVVHAVTFAREHDLPLSVRSGGHSMAGQSTNDGGMMIDLSAMNAIEVDPERGTARIEPGLTWGEVAEAAGEHGLALTSGDMMSVGVGGLTLGGGIGWMVRKYGLTIDHLLSVELVTADGRLVRASEDENSDLFWALRGGGGNFGIATSFEFRLDPAGLILGGAIFYDADNADEILRAYADYTSAAPDELTAMAVVMHAPPAPFIPPHKVGAPVVALLVCYTGDLEEGQRVVQPLRELGTVIADITGPMPYNALFALTAEGAVKGHRHDVRSMYLASLEDDAVHTIVEEALKMSSPHAMAQLRTLGGAMSRVPEDATAFAHRDKPFMFTIVTAWADPAEDDLHRAEALRFWQAIQPHASGVYVNFLADEGEERIKSAYKPATYDRLAALKTRYDPTNLFRHNQNIKPAAEAEDDLLQRAA
jgi:FAD/FMN-containing dehydrogenase